MLIPEQALQLLVESVKDYAIFILDAEGRVATWNAGAARLKSYRAREIIGRHFSVFYPESDVRAGKCELELEVAAREGRFEDEGWRVRKDGSQFWANVVITALRNAHGALVGFGKVTRDLTERKRSEEERAARLAAEQANRAKDDFLAMLGHELRNPLAPIMTALQLIKLRGDPKSQREHQVIERQLKQLTRLVDDLLDVARIARGANELRRAPVEVRDILAKAVESALPLIEKRRHHFEVKAPPYALVVDADLARLIQVFANLLTNAAKYTDPGGHISVLVRRRESEIAVEVRDDGHGIEPDLLPRVFDRFVQAEQDTDRAEGGLGLGLTLVRWLVEQHGGSVEARSAGLGHGSSFVVRLPAVAVAADEGTLAADDDLATTFVANPPRRRILVVDDNDDARELLAEMLAALGHEVRAAGNGPEALAVLADFHADVAILDIGLPGMDGFELARRIKLASYGHPIRLIALSGYGQPADEERGREAGFDIHLVKPVDTHYLIDQLAPHAAQIGPTRGAPPATARA